MAPRIGNKALIAVLLGNTFEFYCFILFVVLAPYISKSFFASMDQNLSYIVAYGINFFGYLSRPFGAIVLGGYSDSYSRKKALCISVLITGIITFLIGIVPSYSSIGALAVILLIVLRFTQGFLVSGEEVATAVYLSEIIDQKRRCYIGAFVLSSVFFGILLGRFVCNLTEACVSNQFMLDFGWRIPFLLALPIAVIISVLRTSVPELPWQSSLGNISAINIMPLKSLLQEYKSSVLKLIISCGAFASLTCLVMIYLPNEQKEIMPPLFFILGIAFMIIILPVLGYLSDLLSPRKVLIFGLLSTVVSTLPCMYLIGSGALMYKAVALMILYFNTATIAAPIFTFLVEMFPRHNRCTGVSFVFNTAVSIFSGAFPLVCSIIKNYYSSALIPGYLITILALLSVIALIKSYAVKEDIYAQDVTESI